MLERIVFVTVRLTVVRVMLVIVIVVAMSVRMCVPDSIEVLVHVQVRLIRILIDVHDRPIVRLRNRHSIGKAYGGRSASRKCLSIDVRAVT